MWRDRSSRGMIQLHPDLNQGCVSRKAQKIWTRGQRSLTCTSWYLIKPLLVKVTSFIFFLKLCLLWSNFTDSLDWKGHLCSLHSTYCKVFNNQDFPCVWPTVPDNNNSNSNSNATMLTLHHEHPVARTLLQTQWFYLLILFSLATHGPF